MTLLYVCGLRWAILVKVSWSVASSKHYEFYVLLTFQHSYTLVHHKAQPFSRLPSTGMLTYCSCILLMLCTVTMHGCMAEVCTALEQNTLSVRSQAVNGEIRWVDPEIGTDNNTCGAAYPCASLEYALYLNESIRPYNISIYIASSSLLDTQVLLHTASLISIIGSAGPERTQFQCAAGNDSAPSVFQILNSSNIYIANITFTNCGPEESNVFVTGSVDVVFENCIFRYANNEQCKHL